MTVFHYEWKRSRKYILIWGLSLAVCIFSMIPVYYSMIETPELLPKNFAEGGFFETVGISLALLLEPLGMYGFLNAFFCFGRRNFRDALCLIPVYKRMYRKHSRIPVHKTLRAYSNL